MNLRQPLMLLSPPTRFSFDRHTLFTPHFKNYICAHTYSIMAAARPQVSVYNVEGASVAEVPLPAVLTVSEDKRERKVDGGESTFY
jgi:hypothetical protein